MRHYPGLAPVLSRSTDAALPLIPGCSQAAGDLRGVAATVARFPGHWTCCVLLHRAVCLGDRLRSDSRHLVTSCAACAVQANQLHAMAHQGLGAVLSLICYAAMLCSNCMTRGLEQQALVKRHFCSKRLLRRAACACKRSAGNEISSADGTHCRARYGVGQQLLRHSHFKRTWNGARTAASCCASSDAAGDRCCAQTYIITHSAV